MRKSGPTFISLFAGCGGFDLGFQAAGYRCLGAFDISKAAIDVYRSNLCFEAQCCDLTNASFSRQPSCDVVIAGPPCQGFSTIGKRKVKDPRNDLLVIAAQLALQIRPKVVVIENVAGAIAGKHAKYWRNAAALLREKGYKVAQIVCRADEMGLPQIRKRILLFAWRTPFNGSIVLPGRPGGTLRDAIASISSDLPNHLPRYLDSSTLAGRIALRIAPGQKLSNVRISSRSVHTWDIPEVFGATNKMEREVLQALARRRRQQRLRSFGDGDPVSARSLAHFVGYPVANVLNTLVAKGFVRHECNKYELMHTFNGKYRRLTWDLPAPTVDTKYGDPRYFLHPEEQRAFSVREAARVQGFPDSFAFSGFGKQQYQMVANAVPPPLSELLASYLTAESIL